MSETIGGTITTVLLTYRRPRLLRRSILSALQQSYRDLVVSVSDNASGDETKAVVQSLAERDPRVQYSSQSANIGAQRNLVHGMRCVRTPFFSMLADDDLLLPRFYEVAYEELMRHPEAMFVVTGCIIVDGAGRVQDSPAFRWPDGLYEPPHGVAPLLNEPQMWTGILFRSQVLETVGVLDPEVGPPSDLDFIVRIAARFPYVVRTVPGAIYVAHEDSAHKTLPFSDYASGWLKMISNIEGDSSLPSSTSEYVGGMLRRYLGRWATALWIRGVGTGDMATCKAACAFLHAHGNRPGLAAALQAGTSVCGAARLPRAMVAGAYRMRKERRFDREEIERRYRRELRLMALGLDGG